MAQAPKSTLAALMNELSLDDLVVDTEGRVRITNPDLAKRIADIKGAGEMPVADSLNTGTCNNTACLAPGLDQLARRGNPAAR